MRGRDGIEKGIGRPALAQMYRTNFLRLVQTADIMHNKPFGYTGTNQDRDWIKPQSCYVFGTTLEKCPKLPFLYYRDHRFHNSAMTRGEGVMRDITRARNRTHTQISTQRELDPRLRWALAWLQQSDVVNPLRLGELAKAVNLSSSRLWHIFRSQIGVTPHRYVKLLRLQKAQQLLRNSFLEVKEVATRTGFGDVSHFARDYKTEFGETPSETRLRSKAS